MTGLDELIEKQFSSFGSTTNATLPIYRLNRFPVFLQDIEGIKPLFYLINGMPKTAKTSFMINLFLDLAESNDNLKCLFFSLYYPIDRILTRIYACSTGIPEKNIETRTIEPDSIKTLAACKEKIKDLYFKKRLDIIEARHLSKIQSIIDKEQTKNKKVIVFIDALHTLTNDSAGATPSPSSQKSIPDEIITLCRTYQIPIFATIDIDISNAVEAPHAIRSQYPAAANWDYFITLIAETETTTSEMMLKVNLENFKYGHFHPNFRLKLCKKSHKIYEISESTTTGPTGISPEPESIITLSPSWETDGMKPSEPRPEVRSASAHTPQQPLPPFQKSPLTPQGVRSRFQDSPVIPQQPVSPFRDSSPISPLNPDELFPDSQAMGFENEPPVSDFQSNARNEFPDNSFLSQVTRQAAQQLFPDVAAPPPEKKPIPKSGLPQFEKYEEETIELNNPLESLMAAETISTPTVNTGLESTTTDEYSLENPFDLIPDGDGVNTTFPSSLGSSTPLEAPFKLNGTVIPDLTTPQSMPFSAPSVIPPVNTTPPPFQPSPNISVSQEPQETTTQLGDEKKIHTEDIEFVDAVTAKQTMQEPPKRFNTQFQLSNADGGFENPKGKTGTLFKKLWLLIVLLFLLVIVYYKEELMPGLFKIDAKVMSPSEIGVQPVKKKPIKTYIVPVPKGMQEEQESSGSTTAPAGTTGTAATPPATASDKTSSGKTPVQQPQVPKVEPKRAETTAQTINTEEKPDSTPAIIDNRVRQIVLQDDEKFGVNWTKTKKGLKITRVTAGPFKKAGVREGDVVILLDGKPLSSEADLLRVRDSVFLGQRLSAILKIHRGDTILQFKLVKNWDIPPKP